MRDAWADADERDAMIAEGDRLRAVLTAVERERDDARLREDSAHAYAKRLLGDGPNLMEMIRRGAEHIERLKAENASLREELEEARNEACVRCGFPTHDIISAAVAENVSLRAELEVWRNEDAREAKYEAVSKRCTEVEKQNASLLESLRAREAHIIGTTKEWNALRDAVAAAEQRAEAAEKERDEARQTSRLKGVLMQLVAAEQRCEKLEGALRDLVLAIDGGAFGRDVYYHDAQEAVLEPARAALHDEERSAPPARQDGEPGPTCHCGKPSTERSGLCGDCYIAFQESLHREAGK